MFSKVNGRTLIRKDTWGVVRVDMGRLYPLNVGGPVSAFSRHATSDYSPLHSKQEEIRSASPSPPHHPYSFCRDALREHRHLGPERSELHEAAIGAERGGGLGLGQGSNPIPLLQTASLGHQMRRWWPAAPWCSSAK